jgi:hypothetical protein
VAAEKCVRNRIGKSRVQFTVALWAKWLKRLDERPSKRLRKGIQEMRSLLAARDIGIMK